MMTFLYEDAKGVMRTRKSRKANNTMAKQKGTNNVLQNMIQKTKD
jgi:hypothetical protein